MIYATNPRAQQAQKCDGDSISGWRTCLQLETPSQAGDRRINQDQTGWPGGSGDVRLRLEEYRVPDVQVHNDLRSQRRSTPRHHVAVQ